MIRSELKSADGTVHWLLVPQAEHARISGVIAEHWTAADLSPFEYDHRPVPRGIREEILAAITHHDDGWKAWEATPRIDAEQGRPYSFMNELPLEESLRIWDDSIAAARRFGVLAGWLVASHFYELLHSGRCENDPRAADWLAAAERLRESWLDEWERCGSGHRRRFADRGLRLLQLCDYFSLWLYCERDTRGADSRTPLVGLPGQGAGPYRLAGTNLAEDRPAAKSVVAARSWRVAVKPWPFDSPELLLSSQAWLVPVKHYATAEELQCAHRPVELHWRLTDSA